MQGTIISALNIGLFGPGYILLLPMSGFLHSTPSFLVSLTSVPLLPFNTLQVWYSAFCHTSFSLSVALSVCHSFCLSLYLCHYLCLSLFASVRSLCVYYFSVCHSLRLSLTSSVTLLAYNYPVCNCPCILLSHLSLSCLTLLDL